MSIIEPINITLKLFQPNCHLHLWRRRLPLFCCFRLELSRRLDLRIVAAVPLPLPWPNSLSQPLLLFDKSEWMEPTQSSLLYSETNSWHNSEKQNPLIHFIELFLFSFSLSFIASLTFSLSLTHSLFLSLVLFLSFSKCLSFSFFRCFGLPFPSSSKSYFWWFSYSILSPYFFRIFSYLLSLSFFCRVSYLFFLSMLSCLFNRELDNCDKLFY